MHVCMCVVVVCLVVVVVVVLGGEGERGKGGRRLRSYFPIGIHTIAVPTSFTASLNSSMRRQHSAKA